MAAWSHYFQFEKDTRFHIDGPFGYDGEGRVLERTDTVLSLRIDLPRWGPAPKLHADLTIEYMQEGEGNLVVLAKDGEDPQRDENATVLSDDDKKKRRISANAITFTIRNEDDDDEIDFDVYVDGKWRDFDLERR